MSVLTYVEELERKTIAYCEDVALRHEQGVLSDRELKLVMDAAWQITSGLVDQMGEIQDEVQKMALSGVVKTTAIPAKGGPIVLFNRDGFTVSVSTMGPGTQSVKKYGTEVQAVAAIKDAASRLEAKGYVIL